MPLRTNGPKREKQRIDIILKSEELISGLEEEARQRKKSAQFSKGRNERTGSVEPNRKRTDGPTIQNKPSGPNGPEWKKRKKNLRTGPRDPLDKIKEQMIL